MRQRKNTWLLLALAGVGVYLCYVVARPFLNAIFAAVVLAVVFVSVTMVLLDMLREANAAPTQTERATTAAQ